MKKLFSLCLICLLALSAMAQRAAVMEFKAGVGISQANVDGLSGIFTTYGNIVRTKRLSCGIFKAKPTFSKSISSSRIFQ